MSAIRKMHAFRYTTAECRNPFTKNVSLQKKMGKRKVKGQAFATFSHDTRAYLFPCTPKENFGTFCLRIYLRFIIFEKGTGQATPKKLNFSNS